MKNKSNAILAAAFSAVMLAGCSPKAETKPEARVETGTVTVTPAQRERLHVQTIKSSTFHQTVDATGSVTFDNDQTTTILAPMSGPAAPPLASLGAQVKAGDPLALVNSPDYATAIGGYRKAVVTAKNLRRIADLDKQLLAADAMARRDLEQAQTDAINAEADRDAALQQLRSIGVTEEAIRDIQEDRPVSTIAGTIRSPLAGTVVEKLISPGQLLQAGTTPCFTVANLSQVWVMAGVSESQLSSIAIGDVAEVFTSASPNPLPGVVDNVSAIVDPNSLRIVVRVVTKNPGQLLKKQMYVHVLIHSTRETTALLVPASAILRDEENLPFVFIQKSDGSFERRHVTLGTRNGDDYEINNGLKEGEQLIVDGGLFVQFQQDQ